MAFATLTSRSTSCLRSSAPASPPRRSRAVFTCASVAPVAPGAPSSSKQAGGQESFADRVQHVKDILKKEHEHHGQGKVMWLHVEGRGRRMTAGHDVEHTPDLSGKEAVRSVDYSLFG